MKIMQGSGLWDMALYQDPAKQFILTGDASPSRPLSWVENANWQAKNHFVEGRGLERLAVRTNWTPGNLLDQLNVELPLTGPSHLYLKNVANRPRALHKLVSENKTAPAFDLAVDSDKRVRAVYWPSTEGTQNFSVDVDVQKLQEEFWLFLRSDPEKKQGLRIGFTNDLITVEQEVDGQLKELAIHPMVWGAHRAFSCRVILSDKNLKLQMKGRSILDLKLPHSSPSAYAKFGIMLYGRLRGSAQANQISLTFTPRSPKIN
jgi:hypothetical protein